MRMMSESHHLIIIEYRGLYQVTGSVRNGKFSRGPDSLMAISCHSFLGYGKTGAQNHDKISEHRCRFEFRSSKSQSSYTAIIRATVVLERRRVREILTRMKT
jgi:hypothetical protein